MRIGGIRRVVTSVLLCVFVLGMFIVFPQANGLEVPMYYIYSLEEYEAELAKYELPGDYVTYDMVKTVGEFVNMRLGITKKLSADDIYFTLRDEAGIEVDLSMNYPDAFKNNWNEVAEVTDIHDLSCSESPYKGAWQYVHGDITYFYYHDGNLDTITWTHRERVYKLHYYGNGEGFRNYPRNADTFAARLLDVDTAQAAVDELMASVDAGQEPLRRQEFWRDLREWSIVIAGAAVIVGGGVIIWKLRERKRLLEEIEEEEFKAAYKDA